MIVFGVGPGGATPPAWLALIVGGGFIAHCIYRVHQDWRKVTTWGYLVAVFGYLIMGGILLFEGLTLAFRH